MLGQKDEILSSCLACTRKPITVACLVLRLHSSILKALQVSGDPPHQETELLLTILYAP